MSQSQILVGGNPVAVAPVFGEQTFANGTTEALALVGSDAVIAQAPDTGTLYVSSTSSTDVTIPHIGPGAFDGQRLIIQALSLAAGRLLFAQNDGSNGGQMLVAFALAATGDSAVLTYSKRNLTGAGPGWYLNFVVNA